MTATTKTLSRADVQSGMVSIISAALLGAILLYTAGFAEASVLHDAAHDTRHSMAFPCH